MLLFCISKCAEALRGDSRWFCKVANMNIHVLMSRGGKDRGVEGGF